MRHAPSTVFRFTGFGIVRKCNRSPGLTQLRYLAAMSSRSYDVCFRTSRGVQEPLTLLRMPSTL
jgi:hypothetical protein